MKQATKTHTQTSRTGITIERIISMYENGINIDVIALQITKNSKNERYTPEDIKSYIKLGQDTKPKVLITKSQKESLEKDQKENGEMRSRMKRVS